MITHHVLYDIGKGRPVGEPIIFDSINNRPRDYRDIQAQIDEALKSGLAVMIIPGEWDKLRIEGFQMKRVPNFKYPRQEEL